MAVETLSLHLPAAVASGETITFPYPSGSASANYDSSAARLAIGDNTVVGLGANMSVAMGMSGVVVTITGITASMGQTARLTLRRLDQPTSINTVTGYALVEDVAANYTFLKSDTGKTKRLTSESDVTLTLPADFPPGWNCGIIQAAAGAGTFTPTGGSALAGTNTKTGGVDTACAIIVETNTTGAAARYILSGSTAA
jgi:hypothetical protein